MIVFDPYFKGAEVKALRYIEVSDDDLKEATWNYTKKTGDYNRFRIPDTWLEGEGWMARSFLLYGIANEAVKAQRFGLIVAPCPETLFTASIPANAVKVEDTNGAIRSTVGISARDSMNREGVTTALHALDRSKNILVDGQPGNVVSEDVVTDSCFIELVQPSASINGRGLNSPLKGMTPREYETVFFHSMNRGKIGTNVTGWSPDVPFPFPGSQLKVFTKAVTEQGDSGTALIDESERVLGFSFYRTGFKADIEFSTWIWAESVYIVHDLR